MSIVIQAGKGRMEFYGGVRRILGWGVL